MDTRRTPGLRYLAIAVLLCTVPACALRAQSSLADGAPHLKRGVTPADVRWISERLARLTAAQWSDAFRAAGYTDGDTQRFVVRLRQKVDEGLAVAG